MMCLTMVSGRKTAGEGSGLVGSIKVPYRQREGQPVWVLLRNLDLLGEIVLRCDQPAQMNRLLLDVGGHEQRDDLRTVGRDGLDHAREVVELDAVPQHAAWCAAR